MCNNRTVLFPKLKERGSLVLRHAIIETPVSPQKVTFDKIYTFESPFSLHTWASPRLTELAALSSFCVAEVPSDGGTAGSPLNSSDLLLIQTFSNLYTVS